MATFFTILSGFETAAEVAGDHMLTTNDLHSLDSHCTQTETYEQFILSVSEKAQELMATCYLVAQFRLLFDVTPELLVRMIEEAAPSARSR